MGNLNEKIIDKAFDYASQEIPGKVVIVLVLLVGGLIGSGYLFIAVIENLDGNNNNIWPLAILFFILILLFAVLILILVVKYIISPHSKKDHKNERLKVNSDVVNTGTEEIATISENGETAAGDSNSMSGSITTYIVRNNNPERDKKFIDINANVKKTYSVLGTSLKKISTEDTFFEDLANHEVKIRLCTANAGMLVNDVCRAEIENGTCLVISKWNDEDTRKFEVDINELYDMSRENSGADTNKHLLAERHVLIEESHLKEYFKTMTSYKTGMENAKKDLEDICETVVQTHGKDAMEIRESDSFMPVSMTIADAVEEYGQMIVEFQVPFTDSKILFELSKKRNKEMFDFFNEFFETIWERASNEQAGRNV